MEDGLVPFKDYEYNYDDNTVLILVVVEDGLVLMISTSKGLTHASLNPCCSGRWSRTELSNVDGVVNISLNPCCSGRWSRTLLLQE